MYCALDRKRRTPFFLLSLQDHDPNLGISKHTPHPSTRLESRKAIGILQSLLLPRHSSIVPFSRGLVAVRTLARGHREACWGSKSGFFTHTIPRRPYYFVFPRSELNRTRRLYESPVAAIAVNQNRFTVSPYELYPDFNTQTLYEFVTAPEMFPVSLRYSSTYEIAHRDLEQTHELDHTLETCPERLHPLPVKMWTPSGGWREIKIKPVD
jgi:hypothetical protein